MNFTCTPVLGPSEAYACNSTNSWGPAEGDYPYEHTWSTVCPTDNLHCTKSGEDCTAYAGGWKDCYVSGTVRRPYDQGGGTKTCDGITFYWYYSGGEGTGYNFDCYPMIGCTKENQYQ